MRRSMYERLPSFGSRLLMLGIAWWAAAEGSTYNLPLAAAVVFGAALSSVVLTPPSAWRLVWSRAALFFLWFMGRSVRAGIEVAWTAMQPRMPIEPGLLEYPVSLPEGAPRALFIMILSLTPGTLSVRSLPHAVLVHVLDARTDVVAGLEEYERRVQRLFVARPGDG
jgi:multicomponent Na+:H+ antiporter subunit E